MSRGQIDSLSCLGLRQRTQKQRNNNNDNRRHHEQRQSATMTAVRKSKFYITPYRFPIFTN